MNKFFFSLALAGCMLISTQSTASQILQRSVTQTSPEWLGNLLLASTDLAAQSSPTSTHEELPGLGHKFELLFAMGDDQDPQNPTNDVISVLTTESYPAGIGVALRNTPPGFKIAALTNQLQLK